MEYGAQKARESMRKFSSVRCACLGCSELWETRQKRGRKNQTEKERERERETERGKEERKTEWGGKERRERDGIPNETNDWRENTERGISRRDKVEKYANFCANN